MCYVKRNMCCFLTEMSLKCRLLDYIKLLLSRTINLMFRRGHRYFFFYVQGVIVYFCLQILPTRVFEFFMDIFMIYDCGNMFMLYLSSLTVSVT